MCYPSDQFYLPVNDALNLQIRYPRREAYWVRLSLQIELMTQ
jgi:hypothetical protein